MSDLVDMDRIRADHGRAFAAIEKRLWERYGQHRYGESFKQGARWGIDAAIEWLLTTQHGINDLTVTEIITELRKGSGSVFWPLKSQDPKVFADCPACHRMTVTDAEGLCGDCGTDLMEEYT